MLISRKRIHTLAPPSLKVDGIPLTQAMEYKYLGVTIASDISWSAHITNVCNKTRKIIEIFYRRFYRHSSSSTLLKLYLSHIRPHLEYCSAVWNPHHEGDIIKLEKVQKYALRVCMKYWNTSYEDLLETSNTRVQAQQKQCLSPLENNQWTDRLSIPSHKSEKVSLQC